MVFVVFLQLSNSCYSWNVGRFVHLLIEVDGWIKMWWKGLFLFCIESKEKWQKTYPSLRRRAAQFASGARRSSFLGCCFPPSYRAVQTEREACVETSVGVQPSLTSTLKSGDVEVPPRWPVLLALRALASSVCFCCVRSQGRTLARASVIFSFSCPTSSFLSLCVLLVPVKDSQRDTGGSGQERHFSKVPCNNCVCIPFLLMKFRFRPTSICLLNCRVLMNLCNQILRTPPPPF